MKSITLSIEQKDIISSINNNNVIVDSVAGSGKTTLILNVVKEYKNLNCLILTYNARLKLETREKIKVMKLSNGECHSFNSFCVRYYDDKAYTNIELMAVLKNKTMNKKEFKYDLIIIDEAQDITPTFYELICKIYMDNNNKHVKFLIVGDKKQCINHYIGSDDRFLKYAEMLFNFNSLNWTKHTLSKSFRITKPMADFINNCCLVTPRIFSEKKSKYKPRYKICDVMNYTCDIGNEIMYYINKYKYKPEDIFIIAPSVKNPDSPIRKLERYLISKKICIYLSTYDDEKIDEEIIKNKIVITTFNSVKGLERKVIILFNMDNSYYKFFGRDILEENRNICPNIFYVALTRGLERLSIIHHSKNNYIEFLNKKKILKYCDVIGCIQKIQKNNKTMSKRISVTELTKYIDSIKLDEYIKKIKLLKINEPENINITNNNNVINNIEGIDIKEDVSSINGIAIPAYYEYKIKKRSSIYKALKTDKANEFIKELKKNKIVKIYDKFLNLNNKNLSIEDILFISTLWWSYKENLYHKLVQINEYNWLLKNTMEFYINRLSELKIDDKCKFENEVDMKNKRCITGRMDCYNNDLNILYEFKCKNKIQYEDILQTMIYGYLLDSTYETQWKNKKLVICGKKINEDDYEKIYKKSKVIIFNIYTNEKIELDVSKKDMNEIVDNLIEEKYNKNKNKKTDKEFYTKYKKLKYKYKYHIV